MPPRVQIQQIEKQQRQPAARPVDAFVRPGQSSARRLAQALGSISPTLFRLGLQLQREKDVGEFREGEEFVREFSRQGRAFRDAVHSGRITADRSPFFRLGAEEQLGRIMADQFNTQLLRATLRDEKLRESTDPADFDIFAQQFHEQFLEDEVGASRTEQFERGFGPRALAHMQNARLAFESQAGGRLITKVKEQTYQEFRSVLQQEFLAGRDPVDALKLTDQRQFEIGLTGTELSNLMTLAVIDEAKDRLDLTMLLGEDGKPNTGDEILNRIPTGKSGSFVGRRPQTVEEVDRAVQQITSRIQSDRNAEWIERQRALSVQRQNARVFLAENFAKGQDVLEEAQAMDPANSDELVRLFGSLQEGRFGSDQGVVQDFLADIYTFDSPDQDGFITKDKLVGAMNARKIDQRDFAFLVSHMESREDRRLRASEGGKDPYRNPRFQDAQRALDRFFKKNPITGVFATPVLAEKARIAQAQLTDAWLGWMATEEGMNSTPQEQNKWLFDTVGEFGFQLQDPFDLNVVAQAGLPDPFPDPINTRALTLRELDAIESSLNRGEVTDEMLELFLMLGVDPSSGNASQQIRRILDAQRALLIGEQAAEERKASPLSSGFDPLQSQLQQP